jgi:hypothetical protein
MKEEVATMAYANPHHEFDRQAREAALRGEVSSRGFYGLERIMLDTRAKGKLEQFEFTMSPLMPLLDQALAIVDTIPEEFWTEENVHRTILQGGGKAMKTQLIQDIKKESFRDESSTMYSWENITRLVDVAAKWLESQEKKAS